MLPHPWSKSCSYYVAFIVVVTFPCILKTRNKKEYTLKKEKIMSFKINTKSLPLQVEA